MDLIDEIGQLRRRMSSFRRVALHVHSPGSWDWPRDSKDPRDSAKSLWADPDPYFHCLQENYDLVAITDHMKAEFACEKCSSLRGCVVLPGMEISATLTFPFSPVRVHFLAVFPEGHTPERIDRVFAGKGLPGMGERTGKETVQVSDVGELRRLVKGEGGLLIAAHVDSEDGGGYRAFLRDEGRGAIELVCDEKEHSQRARDLGEHIKRHLLDAQIDALEVHRPQDATHYRFTLGDSNREIATVLRNDAHNLHELEDGPCTYMKMAQVGFQGLRQALRFPDTRIRHTKPSSSPAWIKGLRITGSQGKFEDTTLAFSPNLTCIIGARGTGKSAVVDAIRYIFGYNRTIGKRIKDHLAVQVQARQEETLGGASVALLYACCSGVSRQLVAEYRDRKLEYNTKVIETDNRETGIVDVETHGEFPCRLYGWSEIERLGSEAEGQRDLIDHILGLHAHIERRRQITSDLKENRKQVEYLAVQLETCYQESKELQRLREFEKDFTQADRKEVAALVKRVDVAQRQLKSVQHADKDFTTWFKSLAPRLDLPVLDMDEEVRKPWHAAKGDEALLNLEQAAVLVRSAANEVHRILSGLREHFETHLKAANESLRGEVKGDDRISQLVRKRAAIGDQLRAAQEQKREYNSALDKLQVALKTRRNLSEQLAVAINQVSAARSKGIADLATALAAQEGPDIAIQVHPHADTAAYKDWLESALKPPRIHYQTRKRIAEAVSQSFGPLQTAKALLQRRNPDNLLESDVEAFEASLIPFGDDKASGVLRVDPTLLDSVLQADEHPPEDLVEVTLDGTPITSRSPGQKCSALLPIILLGSDAPLVLDQPEDNLDNQLVTDLLIRALHEQKQRRQIIVVTHNPNIVAIGDAEHVIVMDSEDGNCKVRYQASIDDEKIMRDIMALMEGGKEALAKRYKRYWPEEELPRFLRGA